MRIRWAVAVAMTAMLATAACGEEPNDCGGFPGSGASQPPATSANDLLACVDPDDEVDEKHNQTDDDYVQDGITEYSSLIGLGELTGDRSDADAIRDLGEDITKALKKPQETLQDLEDEWDLPEIVYDQFEPASITVPAMMPDPQWEELRNSEGEEFDQLWVEMMEDRLEGAIASIEQLVDDGRNSELRELATDVQELLEGWLDDFEQIKEDLPQ